MVEPVQERPEQFRIVAWRFEQLQRAGYDLEWACVLAEMEDVDLHEAVALLERGASIEEAVRILL